jgi:hypothetical protein
MLLLLFVAVILTGTPQIPYYTAAIHCQIIELAGSQMGRECSEVLSILFTMLANSIAMLC